MVQYTNYRDGRKKVLHADVQTHKRAVMMIELPFFPFCAMMNARKSLRACLYCWMLIGLVSRQIDRDFVKENAMNVIEAIHCRRSYKGKYKDIPVPKEDLIKIMQAGLDAPSGCNMQTTSLIALMIRRFWKKSIL